MLALCFSIFTSAIERLISPEKVQEANLVLIVGGVGLGVNLIGVGVFLDETFREMKKNKKKEQSEEQSAEECRQRDSNASRTNQSFMIVDETSFPMQSSPQLAPPLEQKKFSVTSIDLPKNWSHEKANEKGEKGELIFCFQKFKFY